MKARCILKHDLLQVGQVYKVNYYMSSALYQYQLYLNGKVEFFKEEYLEKVVIKRVKCIDRLMYPNLKLNETYDVLDERRLRNDVLYYEIFVGKVIDNYPQHLFEDIQESKIETKALALKSDADFFRSVPDGYCPCNMVRAQCIYHK